MIVTIAKRLQKPLLKLLKIALSALCGLIVVGVILFTLLFSRLSFGPIDLKFVNTYLQQALHQLLPDHKIQFKESVLVWNKWHAPLQIQMNDLTVIPKNGDSVYLPSIKVGVNIIPCLQGKWTISHINLQAPRITLNDLYFPTTKDNSSPNKEPLLDLLASFTNTHPFLRNIETISISQAELILKNKGEWKNFDISLSRQKQSLGLYLKFPERSNTSPLTLHLELPLHQDSPFTTIKAELSNLNPAEEAENLKNLLPESLCGNLRNYNLPLSGHIQGRIELLPLESLSIAQLVEKIKGEIQLSCGKGELKLPDLYPGSLKITEGHIHANAADKKGEVKELSLVLETPSALPGSFKTHLKGTLQVQAPENVPILALEATAEGFPLDDLKTWWPVSIAPDPREWLIANLTKGISSQTRLTLTGSWPEGSQAFKLDSLKGYIDFQGTSVRYINELPPVTQTKGRANFDHTHFNIQIEEGSLESLKLIKGDVIIAGLNEEDQDIRILVSAKGPLQNVLRILDQKPLEFLRPYGIDPQKTIGHANIDLTIDFPVEKHLSLDKVNVDAKAQLSQVIFKDFKLPIGTQPTFNKGTMDLKVSTRHLDLEGTIFLGNSPLQIQWHENFRPVSPPSKSAQLAKDDTLRRLKVEAFLSEQSLKLAGLHLESYLAGPLNFKATYQQETNLNSELKTEINFKDAELDLPLLSWEKLKGEKATAAFTLSTTKNMPPEITSLIITAPYLHLEGKGRMNKKGDQLERIEIPYFKVGNSNFGLKVELTPPSTYRLYLTGTELDAQSLYDKFYEDEDNMNSPPNLEVHLDLGVLKLGEQRLLRKVRGILKSNGETWNDVRLRGQLDPLLPTNKTKDTYNSPKPLGSNLILERTTNNGSYKTIITAKNGGEFLRVFNLYSDIIGGDLVITLNRSLKGPNEETGHLKLKDFHVRNAPLLTRLLSLAGPTGVVDLLSGQGMGFHKFKTNISLTPKQVTFKDGLAVSLGLGISIAGTVGRIDPIVNLKGNVIPAYAVNSILGQIPIIGELLSGGSGEGIFAASYTIKGTTEKPVLSVNPVSVFTPGFLRKIFEVGDEQEKAEAKESAEQ